jgi:hypothetical protein
MPITPTCPGIFPDEFSRDHRAIAALPTSVTAFVGRAARGPIDEPVAVSEFADFARVFGALGENDSLGLAVRTFFETGGAEAVVVRTAKNARAAKLEYGPVKLSASSEGGWGNQLRIRIRRGPDSAFHLQVRDGITGRIETHPNLTLRDSPRRIDRVVNALSQLVRWTADPPDADARVLEHAHEPAAGRSPWTDDSASTKVGRAGRGSCGCELGAADFVGPGRQANQQGLYALERADLFNLLVIPPYRDGRDVEPTLWKAAARYCRRRRALLLVDPPPDWADPESASDFLERLALRTPHAAICFPPQPEASAVDEPGVAARLSSATAAGLFARTDAQRGVWRAPVGLGATLGGVAGCLRTRFDESLGDDSRYVSVRRTALFLEESLHRGLRWVTFEANDESLWEQIRASVRAFMHGYFRLGAFQGRTPREAYFVKCDKETTSARDIELGVLNLVVGFAPLRAAEFVTVGLQEIAGKPSA